MNSNQLIPNQIPYVSRRGTIVLSNSVVADGFRPGFACRVQSHVHTDHMDKFDESKRGQILCSEATRDLLIADLNADLQFRANGGNFIGLKTSVPYTIGSDTITVFGSNHMLGSVQILVSSNDYGRVGYSGDFGWPIDEVPKIDRLVLDSTYGSPVSKKLPSREVMLDTAVNLIRDRLRTGEVFIINTPSGAFNRFITDLLHIADIPFLCSDRRKNELQVYEKYGYLIGNPVAPSEPDYKMIQAEGKYLQLIGRGDIRPDINDTDALFITLGAKYAHETDPIIKLSAQHYSLLYSDHADFEKTLEYVEKTEARFVLTDAYRGEESAKQLASYINSELGIEAVASSPDPLDPY